MSKQKSGSKGKGAGAARKAKYLAHKAGSSRKGKNRKQTGGTITTRNKARAAKKHQVLLAKQQERKELRIELLEKVVAKYPRKKMGELTKQFGTLNIRRMTDILDDKFETSDWYLARVARREAMAQAKSAKVVKKHVKFRKRSKKDKAASSNKQVQAVHEG